MSSPFLRSPELVDWYVAALAAGAAYSDGQAVVDVLSGIEPVVVTTYTSPTPFVPNFYVGVSAHYLYLVFPGTSNIQQFVADVLGSPQTSVAGFPGSIALYFGQAAIASYGAARAQLLAAAPGRKIVSIGHSLGGAVAELVAYLLSQDSGQPPLVLTFGEPRVGDSDYASAWPASALLGLQGDSDPVPGVPPILWGGYQPAWPVPIVVPIPVEYTHAGQRQGIGIDGVPGPAPDLDIPDVIAGIWSVVTVYSHAISTYLSYLAGGLIGRTPTHADSGYGDVTHLDAFAAARFSLPPIPWQGVVSEPPTPVPPAPVVGTVFAAGTGGSMNVRFTMEIKLASGQAFSESYYGNHADLNAAALVAPQMANLRRAFLFSRNYVNWVRVSNADVQRQSRQVPIGVLNGGGLITPTVSDPAAAPDDYGIEVTFYDSVGARMRTAIFRGLAERDLGNSGVFGLFSGTERALRAFCDALIGKSSPLGGAVWGVRKRSIGPKYSILSLTNDTRTVTLTLDPADFAALMLTTSGLWIVQGPTKDKLIRGIYKIKGGNVSPQILLPGAFNSGIYTPKSCYIAVLTYSLAQWSTYQLTDDGSRKVGRPRGLDAGKRSPLYSRR